MSRALPLPPRRSAVGRADLLWLLHSLGESGAMEAARLAGYRFEAPQPAPPPTRGSAPWLKPEAPLAATAARRPPLQATHFAVIEHQSFPEPEPVPGASPPNGPLIEDLTGSGEARPPRTPLSPPRRLAVFLRGQLRPATPGRGLDLPQLLGQLVRLRLPRRLPRARQRRWSREAALVIDLSLPAYPLNDDLIELAELAHRLSGGCLCVLARLSGGEWLLRQPGARPDWTEVGAAYLSGARHWLLAGDLGSVADDGRAAGWARRIRRHQASGGEVALLTGGSPAAWRASLPARTRVALWEHGRRPRPQRAVDSGAAAAAADVARLLAALSLAVRVEPGLLRDVRLELGLSMAAELAAWNHADVDHCELGLQIRPDRLAGHRQGAAALPAAQRERVVGLVRRHHQGVSQLIRMEEAALAADLAGLCVDEAAQGWAAAVRTLQQVPAGEAAQDLSAYLARTGRRAHPGLWQAVPALEEAYVIARRAALRAGAEVPAGVSAQALAQHVGEPGEARPTRPLWLLRRGSRLEAHTREPGPGCFVLSASPDCNGFELESPGQSSHWQALLNEPVVLGELLSGAGPWTVETSWVRAKIAEVPRPSWAIEWGCDSKGLYALAPSPFGGAERLNWAPPGASGDASWPPTSRGFSTSGVPVGDGVWLGADLEYGLYLDVALGNATQRFRWIEPGEFLMGPPKGEVEQSNDEGPQHVVRLTEGYWLADTACSQMVWEAVTGGKPSDFKDDPQSPVEQVTWDDVVGFLLKVEGLLPGLQAALPTEAEWEYACRAGAEMAFNWGREIITPQQNLQGETRDEKAAPRVFRGGSWIYDQHWLRAASRGSWRRDWRLESRGFRFLLRSASPGAERSSEALSAQEGPQGESQAPGRGQRSGGGGVSPARRSAGPATLLDRIKASLFGQKSLGTKKEG